MVIHKTSGQTVYYTTSTITPPIGGNATAYLFLAGLPYDVPYEAMVFVVTPAGVIISVASTIAIPILSS